MATTNGQYAVSLGDQDYVHVWELNSLDNGPRELVVPARLHHGARVLALSTLQPQLLAVSSGSGIQVYDIANGSIRHTLSGTGRIVTALSWSGTNSDLLAVGTIDGSISLYGLQSSNASISSWPAGRVCKDIAFRSTEPDVFVVLYDDKIVVCQYSGGSIITTREIASNGGQYTSLLWHSSIDGSLVASTSTGSLRVWNAAALLDDISRTISDRRSSSSDSDDGFFGGLENISDLACTTFENVLPSNTILRSSIGQSGILCLGSDGKKVMICSFQPGKDSFASIWSGELTRAARTLAIHTDGNTIKLLCVLGDGIHALTIPSDVLSVIGWKFIAKAGATSASVVEKKPDGSPMNIVDSRAGMKPISISAIRELRGGFSKISRQLQQRRRSSSKAADDRFRSEQGETNATKQEPQSPGLPQSMTSSLELPKQRDGDGSPMPFLSPSIPSRKPSPNDVTALDESIKLPPLPRASFDSSLNSSSAAGPDSDDSDDDTFVDGMQTSATFLPGGINVPLPKACAATFGPTGELLTFFPPKPRVVSGRDDDDRDAGPGGSKRDARKVAGLFPTFGNLLGASEHHQSAAQESDTDSMSSSEADMYNTQPTFAFQASSFPSQQSWKSRISPTKHSFVEPNPHKVMVRVYGAGTTGYAFDQSRHLASEYHLLPATNESSAQLCEDNADVANSAGLDEVAEVWTLLGMLLEGRLTQEVLDRPDRNGDLAKMAGRIKHDEQRSSLDDLSARNRRRSSQARIRWADHPFGAHGIVRAVFDWAEARADTQLMATLAVILAQEEASASARAPSTQRGYASRMHPYSLDYFASDDASHQARRASDRPIPILRKDSAPQRDAYESPVKPQRSSTMSSNNLSQPGTPYVGSLSSTPPLSLPSISRQTSRLSNSGSASPEHHRSSFSAAAKYYAQSITDKFASYGTSPPARRLGASPGGTINELSTSFPSGSWGKSVSFASTTDTSKTSLLSQSFQRGQE